MRVNDFPPELDLSHYRRYPDLASLSDEELTRHYTKYGRDEGRFANVITDRSQFIAVMPKQEPVLEIGPFCNPLVVGTNVRYFDVHDQQSLISRARRIGRELRLLGPKHLPQRRSWRFDIRKVPKIDFVSPTGDLSLVNQRFATVVSSHCIEHQPVLIRHLQIVHDLLIDGGFYFIVLPDKRYCFDHFIRESTIADIIDAHLAGRRIHTAKSVIENLALTTHTRHWKGDHGQSRASDAQALSGGGQRVRSGQWQLCRRTRLAVHSGKFPWRHCNARRTRICSACSGARLQYALWFQRVLRYSEASETGG